MSMLEQLAAAFPVAEFEQVLDPPQDVAHVPAEIYPEFVAAAKTAGFDVFVDLCGVDYLRRNPRFDVVVNLLSYEPPARLRIRVGVTASDPSLATISNVFPGANFYEREAFDLFGIVFTGHPDLTRLVMISFQRSGCRMETLFSRL